jgi:ferritin-like metal-binding protein YciE
MAVKNPKELFVRLLSDVKQGTERSERIYQEIGQLAQDPQIKEALEARAFVSGKMSATLDECFRIIGEKPTKSDGRLQEIFLEDFLKELGEMQSTLARRVFILAKLNQLAHVRIGEYVALIAASDAAGHSGVGVLLESCLADKLAFMKRTRRLIRNTLETRVAERAASASA